MSKYNDTTQSVESAFANELHAALEEPFKALVAQAEGIMKPIFRRYLAKGMASDRIMPTLSQVVIPLLVAEHEAKETAHDARSSAN